MTVFALEYGYEPEQAQLRNEHRAAHRAWLQNRVEQGTVLASGPLGQDAGALILVAAASAEEIESIFSEDPFQIHGAIAHSSVRVWNPVIGRLSEFAS